MTRNRSDRPTLRAFLLGSLLLAGCNATPDVHSATLAASNAFKGGSYIGTYAFEGDQLVPAAIDPDAFDLAYYFDGDDCFEGALLGRSDEVGQLFPIGKRSWSELVELPWPSAADSPGGAEAAVPGIRPLGVETEGLAFWLRVRGGTFVLVRVVAVEAANHADLVAGSNPVLQLEWLPPNP